MGLKYTVGSAYNPSLGCLAGTRRDLIENIMANLLAPPLGKNHRLVCLSAVLGSGKSCVAHTIAECCASEGVLASSSIFNRNMDRTDARAFVASLARDLSNRNLLFAERVVNALKENPGLPVASPVTEMFTKLIIEPISATPAGERPLVIVLDALDEVSGNVEDLFIILNQSISSIPAEKLRFFVTFRPEHPFSDLLQSHTSKCIQCEISTLSKAVLQRSTGSRKSHWNDSQRIQAGTKGL